MDRPGSETIGRNRQTNLAYIRKEQADNEDDNRNDCPVGLSYDLARRHGIQTRNALSGFQAMAASDYVTIDSDARRLYLSHSTTSRRCGP